MSAEKIFAVVLPVVVIANMAIFVRRARKNAQPGEADPGWTIIRGFAIWILPAFAIMSAGILTGRSGVGPEGVSRPQVIDYVSISLVLVAMVRGSHWIFREKGAEFVAEHRILNHSPSATGVKLWWAVLAVSCTVGSIMSLLSGS